MKNLCLCALLLLLISNRLAAQVLFYSDNFNGGVTGGGYSPTYSSGGVGNFSVFIQPGSTIHKAYLMAGRHGNAPPITVILNGNPFTFNNTNQVSPTFQSMFYGGNSGTHAIDVTAFINPAVVNYTLNVPNTSGPTDHYNDFYLYIAYDNPALQPVSTVIFVNNFDFAPLVTYNVNVTTPFQTSANIGVMLFTGYMCGNFDADNVSLNGTPLGTIYGPDVNSGGCGGPVSNFYYQNNTLFGMGDDNANQAMNVADVTSNAQAIIVNNSTSFSFQFVHGNADNAHWAMILAYGSSIINPLSVNITGGTSVCAGSCTNLSATVSGGTPPFTFTWTPNIGTGAGPHQVCPTTTTVYSVLVTDSLGDTASASATVIAYPLPILAMTETDVLCNGGSTGTATVTPAGNNPFTYSWSTTPVQTTQTATGLPIGTYTVTVTDVNGCIQTASIVVNEPPPLVAGASTVNSICTACNGSATANPSGGIAPYSYSWNTVPLQNTQTATGLCPGNYTVTVTDANGCAQTASVTVLATPVSLAVNISSETDALCFGDCNGDATAFTNSGTPGYSYLWNTVPPQAAATASSLCAGMYSVQVTDANGCTGTSVASVSEPQPVVAAAPNNVSVCLGQSALLVTSATGGTPGYNYIWNPGNISGPSINVSPASTIIYTVSTTDVNGCTAADVNVTVTVNPLPVVLFMPDITDGCSPVCVSFTNQTLNPVSSNWDFGDMNTSASTNPYHCFTTPGTYDVTLYVTDNNGCTNSLVRNNLINVYQWASADFIITPQPPYFPGTAISFNDISTGASIWTWHFGDPLNSTSQQQNPTFSYDKPDTYTVTLIANNINGCSDTVSHTVRVDAPFDFFVPNVFTPNGDNVNEIFIPEGIGYSTEGYELTVYDRWGAMLFKSKNPAIGWDGRSADGSDMVPEGVYVWTITVHSISNNIKHTYIGHVTVLK